MKKEELVGLCQKVRTKGVKYVLSQIDAMPDLQTGYTKEFARSMVNIVNYKGMSYLIDKLREIEQPEEQKNQTVAEFINEGTRVLGYKIEEPETKPAPTEEEMNDILQYVKESTNMQMKYKNDPNKLTLYKLRHGLI